MAVAARKQPASPSAASRIEVAQAALEESNRKLVQLHEQRNAALLRDDNGAAVQFGIELANLRLAARAEEDKIGLLKAEAAREEQERKDKEREAQIGKIEKLLAARDSAGKELADAVAAADRAFRRLIDIGVEVQAAWNWPASEVPAILASHAAITHALTHELYRVGSRPMVGGGQIEPHGIHAGVHFPGAKVPHELVNLPERIPALTAVLQQATEHASNIMRGKRPSVEDASMSTPASSVNGMLLTTAQERLAGLWKRQAELSKDVSVAGEQEYARVVAEIAVAQAELDAEQQIGTQQHG
jgi:hypothetical protein